MSAPLLGSMGTSITAARPPAFAIVQPQQFPRKQATSFDALESSLSRLHSSKAKWVALSCTDRLELTQQVLRNLLTVAPGLASDSCKAKGSWGGGVGEEMTGLVSIALGLSGFCDLLAAEGQPRPLSMRKRPDGQEIASVFPTGLVGLLFGGFAGEVWLQKGKGKGQGEFYRAKATGKPKHNGKVSLVLGAGNQVSVVALDVLHKLMIEDEVVLLKLNPVNEYVGPHIEALFKPFVSNGWLELCYGGKEVGEYLTAHLLIDSIHLTGSSDTFNAIYWGTPKPQAGPTLIPRITKPFTAELGNVTPYFIVPPPKGVSWSSLELTYHAKNLVAALMQNGGCNCVALELIVTSADWEQRADFIKAFTEELNKRPRLTLSYPGADAKMAAFRQAFPKAQELGLSLEFPSSCPLLLADNLKPDQARYDQESWGPMVQEVVLPSASASGGGASRVQGFLDQAIALSRTQCWGSLACSVIAHPSSVKEVGDGAFDDFIAQLRYGSISVNVPCLLSFALPTLSWGAFPGHTPEDIKSGTGYVHNTMAFDHPEKSVLWGPFVYRPYPFWFCDHRNLEKTVTGTLKFIAAGGAKNGGPGALGTVRCLGLLTSTALEAIKG